MSSQGEPVPDGGGGSHPVEPRPSRGGPLLAWLGLVLAALGTLWIWQTAHPPAATPEIDYSVFISKVQADEVESVAIRGQQVQGEYRRGQGTEEARKFRALLPQRDDQLMGILRDKGVRVKIVADEPSGGTQFLLTLLPWVVIIGVWFWLSRRTQKMFAGGGLPREMIRTKNRRFERNENVQVRFDDVAGLASAKRDLEEVVQFLKEPDRFLKVGGRIPRGVLLVGPPGTGKTLLAKAVAGESGVPFYSISASEFIEMFVGVGAARVRDLFAEARKNAPSILFIDEIDAVGRARGAGLGGGHDEREQTLNQLLSEMDGFESTDSTVVLAATNRPDVLDSALLRPGRFDRQVVLDRPELAARRAILAVHTRKTPLADDVDLGVVASTTPGFSGADLANLVNEAALRAVRKHRDVLTAEDFTAAQDKIVLGAPREAKLDAREKQRVAVHEAGHAVVAHLSECAEALHRVSIIPRGMALGVTQQIPTTDRHILTKEELQSRLRVLLGGYAAERKFLGSPSTGAENDLKTASELAAKMVANYGMSDKFGPVYYEHRAEHPFLGQKIATDGGTSDATVRAVEEEAQRVLLEALAGAETLLTKHRDKVLRLSRALIQRETVEKDELVELLGDPAQQGPVRLVSA